MNNAKNLKIFFIILAIVFLFSYGFTVGYYKIFPYKYIYKVRLLILPIQDNSKKIKPRSDFFKYFSPNVDVVMIGDSITQLGIWNEIFPNVKIANRGVASDTTENVLNRIDTILAVNPSKALIMMGIIDIHSSINIDTIMENYIKLIKKLEAENIEVIVQSTIECSINTCGENLIKLRKLNLKLKKYCEENQILFVNLNKGLSTISEGLIKKYTWDGIHLTGSGYLEWSKQIVNIVN